MKLAEVELLLFLVILHELVQLAEAVAIDDLLQFAVGVIADITTRTEHHQLTILLGVRLPENDWLMKSSKSVKRNFIIEKYLKVGSINYVKVKQTFVLLKTLYNLQSYKNILNNTPSPAPFLFSSVQDSVISLQHTKLLIR